MFYRPNKEYKFVLPQLEINNEEYVVKDSTNTFDLLDKDWVRLSILPELTEYDEEDLKFLYYNKAMTELMSTGVGEHLALNPPYKFTRYADVPEPGRLATREKLTPDSYGDKLGIGPMYSSLIQENIKNRLVYIKVGTPNFQNLFSFFLSSVNYGDAIVAREGRYPYLYYGAKGISTVAMFMAFPLFTSAFYAITFISNLLFSPSPTYYSLKPNMADYWDSVNMIMNSFAVERGVFQLNLKESSNDTVGQPIEVDKTFMKELHEIYPHIFTEDGLINVYGIVGKYQRLIYQQLRTERDLLMRGHVTQETLDLALKGIVTPTDGKFKGNLDKYKETLSKLKAFKDKKGNPEDNPVPKSAKDVDVDKYIKAKTSYDRPILPHQKDDWFDSAISYFKSTVTDGADELVLFVDAVSNSSDTFSNSTKNMPIESVVNNIGGAFRDIRFSVADGNLLGDIVSSVISGMKDTAAGLIDGVTVGIGGLIQALSGGGFLDFPLMWDDSSADISQPTLTIPIHTPYSHPVSMLMDVDLVIASLLALSLPRSIGRTAYTSPPLCSVYIDGVMNIQLGIVDRLTIRRSTSNIRFSDNGTAVGFDIDITFKDLSKVVASPINSGMFSSMSLVMDDYAGINRYIKTIASRPYYMDKYVSRSALIKLTKMIAGVKSFITPESIGVRLGLSGPGQALSAILPIQSGVAIFGGYDKLK